MKRWPTLGVALVSLLLLGTAAVWWWGGRGSDFDQAVAAAPEGAERVLWTDWEAVRSETGVRPTGDPSAETVEALLDAGFRRDLTSTSALLSSAEGLDALGLSPAELDWELFTQSAQGAAVVLAPTIGVADVAAALERSGFDRPAEPAGTWLGGPDTAARLGLGPEFQHWVVLEDEGVVVASDNAPYAAVAAAAVSGEGASSTYADVAAGLDEPVSAVLLDGPHACRSLAMAGADDLDQEQAAVLLESAGGVTPYTAFAMAALPGGDVRMALTFERADQARHDAGSRARLAEGEAPGQGGSFGDRFAVTGAGASGSRLTLDLRPRPGTFPLSDLTSGPVLVASC